MTICPTCGSKIASDAVICPVCGALLTETTGAISKSDIPTGIASAALFSEHVGKLADKQVALYIEHTPQPIIVDVSNGATIGRRSLKESEVMPTVALNAYDAFNKGVSRIHVTLAYSGDQVVIIDEYTTNGTWLNDVRLEPMTPTPVHNGDEIRLSKLRIRVFLPTPVP